MLESLKEEVLKVSRLAEESGLCHHGGGNFSQIDRDSGLVVITPSGASRFAISADDMLVIDLEGKVIENKGNLKPSSEWPMHVHILKNRLDINSVVHTHARNAAVFACLNVPVKPVIIEAIMYGGYCKVMPLVEPGSIDLGKSALDGLTGTMATILGHHGLLTVGEDVYNAYLKSHYVEDVCDANLRAAAIVGYENVPCLSDEQVIAFRDESKYYSDKFAAKR